MLVPRRFPRESLIEPTRPPPLDQRLIAAASEEVEAIDGQDGLDRVYGKVARLFERDLAVRFDLVTPDGHPDPRYVGRGEEFRLVAVKRHLPQSFGCGSVPWETRGGALLLGFLEDWNALLLMEDARLRASLARPKRAVASFLSGHPDVLVALTVVLEGPAESAAHVRPLVTSLATMVWGVADATAMEYRKSRFAAYHWWVDEQFRGGAGGLVQVAEARDRRG